MIRDECSEIKKNLFSGHFKLETKKCEFIQICLDDAEFVYELRKNHKKSFLRHAEGGLESQIKYIEDYSKRFLEKKEIYYKIKSKVTSQIEAVVRITELEKTDSYSWESLIAREGSDPTLPIEIMLTIYKLGFEYLNRKICGPWDVHKSHKSMQKIHKIIGMAKRIAEDDIYYKYAVLKQDYFKFIRKFEHLGFAAIIGENYDHQ